MSTAADLVLVNPGKPARDLPVARRDADRRREPGVGRADRDLRPRARVSRSQIVDAEADELTPDAGRRRVRSHSNPRLVAVVVYGHQPSASTQNMTGASAVATAIKTADARHRRC